MRPTYKQRLKDALRWHLLGWYECQTDSEAKKQYVLAWTGIKAILLMIMRMIVNTVMLPLFFLAPATAFFLMWLDRVYEKQVDKAHQRVRDMYNIGSLPKRQLNKVVVKDYIDS